MSGIAAASRIEPAPADAEEHPSRGWEDGRCWDGRGRGDGECHIITHQIRRWWCSGLWLLDRCRCRLLPVRMWRLVLLQLLLREWSESRVCSLCRYVRHGGKA